MAIVMDKPLGARLKISPQVSEIKMDLTTSGWEKKIEAAIR